MTHKQGVFWSPSHDQGPTLDFIQRIQPPVIRILQPDVTHISDAFRRSPSSLINPRFWDIDDNHGQAVREIQADYRHAAREHVDRMTAKIGEMRLQAAARNMPWPPKEFIALSSANESNRGLPHDLNCKYNIEFGDYATAEYGWRKCFLLNMSVGNPAELTPAGLPDWSAYKPLQPTLTRGDHIVNYHGYWQAQGPTHSWTDDRGRLREDFPHLAGRYRYSGLEAVHVIGECGVDAGIYSVKPGTGWQGMGVSHDEYSRQLETNHDLLEPYVLAQTPFTSDFQSRDWASFNVIPVHDRIAEWVARKDTPPVVVQPPVEPPKPPTTSGDFERALEFVLRMEGGWADNPADPGGATMKGITIGTYTRWRQGKGQPPPSKDDLRNISDAEVRQIYHDWYWQASGADTMAWPLSLIHFDSSVNTGVGQANWFLRRSGGDPARYIAERRAWYRKLNTFPIFGEAWLRRMDDLERLADTAPSEPPTDDIDVAALRRYIQASRANLNEMDKLLEGKG